MKQEKTRINEPYPRNMLLEAYGEETIECFEPFSRDMMAGLHYVLSTLKEREMEILKYRYVDREPLSEIAKRYSLTRESTGKQTPLVTTPETLYRFDVSKNHTIATSKEKVMFFNSESQMIASIKEKETGDFVQIENGVALIASSDSPVVKILKYENHSGANVFTYDNTYDHDEARISADRKTIMLFSYKQFRIYSLDGTLIKEVNIPDPEQVYDQQFIRIDTEEMRKKAEEAERLRRLEIEQTAEGQQNIVLNNKIVDEYDSRTTSTTKFLLKREKTGQIIQILYGSHIIGRSETLADYHIEGNRMIGRTHATLIANNSECLIIDNKSLNKTCINGAELEPNIQYVLRDGDVLKIANELFAFYSK